MANVDKSQLHDFVNGETVDETKLDQNFEVLRVAGNDTNTKANAAALKGANSDITSMTGITGGISTVDYIDVDQTPTAGQAVGRLRWNATDGTLEVGLVGGNVNLQIGQEEVLRVLNNTGNAMTNGQVVYVTGASGQRPTVALALGTGDATSARTIGILTENIANNAQGFVTMSGIVNDVNTSAFAEGSALWLSATTAGAITTTRPVAPNHGVLVGFCVRSHATQGQILVKVQNGFELEELHDVLIGTKANGDILAYDTVSGVWKNKTRAELGLAPLVSPTFSGIVTVPTPTNGTDAANKAYVDAVDATQKTYIDTQDGTKVNKSGDTLTGYLNLHANPTNTNHPATKDYTDSRDALKVSKSGDTMTGSLTLSGNPTQNLEAAPKQYVDQQIANLISSAPGVLDTLDEIAAALGDDPNFATTMTNQLAAKAPLASPTFTGTVTVPEPAASSSAVTKNYVDTVDATKAPINSPSFTGTTNFNGNVDFNKNYAIDLAIVNSATAPTSPVEGQLWYDTTEQRLKVYRGAVKGWTNISSKGAQIKEKIITATAGQTSFSIADVGSYEVGTHNIFVFKNKQLLTKTVDYSEASTTTISLFVGATAGDVLDLIWFENDPEVLTINVQSTVNRTFQTSTAGQTVFTVAGGYQIGLLDVYMNGVRLQLTNDFTATDGTTVVLNSAVTAGQELEFVAFDYAGVAPAVTSFNGRGGNITLTEADVESAITTSLDLPSNGLTVGTNQLVVSGGNVGIGTSSPSSSKLEVVGTSAKVAKLITSQDKNTSAGGIFHIGTSTGGTQDFELLFGRSAAGSGAYYSIQAVEQNIDLRNLVLNPGGGNVGIGTTSPTSKLHVNNGEIRLTSSTFPNNGTYSKYSELIFGNTVSGMGAYGASIESWGNWADTGDLRFNTCYGTTRQERMRIDASGNVGIGTSSPSARLTSTLSNSGGVSTCFSVQNFANGGIAGQGTRIAFQNDAGFINGPFSATIQSTTETISNGAANLTLNTWNGTSLLERMRIDVDGSLQIRSSYIGYNNYTYKKWFAFAYPPAGQFGASVDSTDFYTAGAGSNAQYVQMRLNSWGNLGIRGAYSSSATLNDYAEYFEWADGNVDNEDRIGQTVVLEGKLIRLATEEDSPSSIIGVVSATAGVSLGAGNFEWSGKYVTDDFGRKVMQEVRYVHWEEDGQSFNYQEAEIPQDVVVPENAEWKTYQEPIIVDGFRGDEEYIERPQRKEWACIGLMGQIRVKKGSPIGERWIKMRDVSETVEEWLVR